MKKRTSIIIGIIALILDQLTKVLFINKNMELIPNVLKIYYWQNEGTIFEIANGIKISLIALESIIIIIPIVIYLVKRYSKAKNNIILSLMLILAGAVGNLIDILFRGYVIDFINIANSMNCNLSDVFLIGGIILLFIFAIKQAINKKFAKN